MSRDYHAKRLARDLDIPYAMALRRIRAAQDVTGELESPDSPGRDSSEPSPTGANPGGNCRGGYR
jgi:hypothetical protein